METICNDQILEKDDSFVCRTIDDETIMVPIRSNVGDLESIYTLDEVGARIWEILDGKKTIKEIKDSIVSEYDVTAEEAEKDITEFIEQLKEIKAVRQK